MAFVSLSGNTCLVMVCGGVLVSSVQTQFGNKLLFLQHPFDVLLPCCSPVEQALPVHSTPTTAPTTTRSNRQPVRRIWGTFGRTQDCCRRLVQSRDREAAWRVPFYRRRATRRRRCKPRKPKVVVWCGLSVHGCPVLDSCVVVPSGCGLWNGVGQHVFGFWL